MFLPVFVLMWHEEAKMRRNAASVACLVQLAASDAFAHGAHALARSLGHSAPVSGVIAALS